jgi:hypothetical protein
MAVIEIAKIQVRRGQENQTGVPILDSGEFGWSSDTEHLYIGLRRVDGGSRDANVRILTENDLRNIFQSSSLSLLNTATTYTYRAGTYVTTSTIFGTEIQRTVQEKLDGVVSVLDFGAKGNGADDDTWPIQLAINNLFRKISPVGLTNTEKVLYFPRGTYKISSTIFIPRYTTILGEGIGKTVINQISTGSHFFQTIDGTTSSYVKFESIPPMSSASAPDYISIEKLTLNHASTISLGLSFVSLDCSTNSVIRDVRFLGCYDIGDVTTSTYVGIDIRGYQALTSENVTIDNCQFENVYHGITSAYDTFNHYINNNKFIRLQRGIVFSQDLTSSVLIGPRFARITNNKFQNIANQAIFVGTNTSFTATSHVSMNNQFINVGNNGVDEQRTTNTGTEIIAFYTKNNISQDDYFDRLEWQLTNADSTTTIFKPLMVGRSSINIIQSKNIRGGTTATVMIWPLTGKQQYITVKYQIYNTLIDSVMTIDRKGTLDIYIKEGNNPLVKTTDNYNFEIDEGPQWLLPIIDSTNRFVKFKLPNVPPLGSGATFTVTNYFSLTTYYNISVVASGSRYLPGDVLTLDGGLLPGRSSTHTAYVTVLGIGIGGDITSISWTGTSMTLIALAPIYDPVRDGPMIGTFISTAPLHVRTASGFGNSALCVDYQAHLMTT